MLLHNFINKNEKEILEELRTKPYFFSLLPPIWKENYNICVEAILLYPYNYTYIKEEYKKKRNLAIQAITMCPYLFTHVPSEFKNDMEICLIAIRNYPFNVRHLSSNMKNNEELFYVLVKENSWGLNYMSSTIRNDKRVFENALQINSSVFGCIHSMLKNDVEFLKPLIPKYNLLIQNFSEVARKNKELLKIAIRHNYLNFYFLPKLYYNDFHFLFELYSINKKLGIVLKETKRERVIDKYNFYHHCVFYKQMEKEDNIFHMPELVHIIESFLF
jgi:hypothetical protein